MNRYDVLPTIERDNSAAFGRIAGVHETNEQRRLNLIIAERPGGFALRVQSDGKLFDPMAPPWEDEIPLTQSQVWGAAAAVRKAWRSEVLDRKVGGTPLFLTEWDLIAHRAALEAALPALALAGHELFTKIFFPSKALAAPGAYLRLGEIGERLREAAQTEGSMWLRVTSDSFYAPWNLMYTRALDVVDGHDVSPEGFWGYQNLVEHVPLPPTGGAQNRGQDLAFNSPLNVAVHVDEDIDATLGVACVAPVRQALQAYGKAGGLTVSEGNTSVALATSLNQSKLDQHVLYFCCHAENEGDSTALKIDESCLKLTDRQVRITPGKLDLWLGKNVFTNGPIVFLNGCHTGQMTSVFYQGFVPTFLNRRASAVIGTQTEAPARFAGEFARRFFDRFFKGGISVGGALLEIRRELFDTHNNPLGLLYSIYRGADVRLPVALPGL